MKKILLSISAGLLLLISACSLKTTPLPPNAPPRECGTGSIEWKLAQLYPGSTKILSKAKWDDWLLGQVVAFQTKQDDRKVEIHWTVRIKPWAGGANGIYLFIEQEEFDLYLISSDTNGCFYSSPDISIILFKYRGSAELIKISTPRGWITINPHGGPNL